MKSESKDIIQFSVLEGLSWIYAAIMTVLAMPFPRLRSAANVA